MPKICFMNKERPCTDACAAFETKPSGKTDCRLLGFLDHLVPATPYTRPLVPTPPPKVKP